VSLYPFPYDRLREVAGHLRAILDVEMSSGQMIEDVRLAVGDHLPVSFYGRMGGLVPFPDDILPEIEKMIQSAEHAVPRSKVGWAD
jgi:2-oxoglutarate ferredoxin oxidoreductase subunit alpha